MPTTNKNHLDDNMKADNAAEELVCVEVDAATALEDTLKAVVVVEVEVDDTTSPNSVLEAVEAPETITLANVPSNAVANTMAISSPADV
ncbi:hypothetical protein EIK77_000146 [Talaromyces pinophilus]|nr:hypothetical protein EIK77_000146 [Talaromyces pinophilus]